MWKSGVTVTQWVALHCLAIENNCKTMQRQCLIPAFSHVNVPMGKVLNHNLSDNWCTGESKGVNVALIRQNDWKHAL